MAPAGDLYRHRTQDVYAAISGDGFSHFKHSDLLAEIRLDNSSV